MTVTDSHRSAPATPVFPQDRTCPYDPPPAYPELAAQGPLSRMSLYDGREVWFVTGHAEARALLADPRLSSDRHRPEFPVVLPAAEKQAETDPVPLVSVDDPEHARQRRMLIRYFSHKRITALRPFIQSTVDRLIDAMLAAGNEAELVSAFALPVPSMVICELLGVPYADHDFFEGCSRRLLSAGTSDEVIAARDELLDYLGGLVDEGRAAEGGLLAEVAAEHIATGGTDREELRNIALILLVAGHETTANMISLGTYVLLRHPEQLAALRADPALLPGAVEELLRHLSIADGMVRLATEDIEIAGHTIRAGEGVLFPTSVINRDATVYEDPDRLDVRRTARHHVAFGHGVHQCLGQNLARAEMEIAFSALLTRIPGLRLAVAPEEVSFKPGTTIQGLYTLPVAW
ncbi:cytochrome P450 [Streptomyces mashuensis]|uniref:Cytochrome P450 n=1 Tax=Streptomyces mashuensis TaxID=33904 RepID=A0A919EE06_9ACTN|nr:cytochrome P450 [Streptomyces mashuensis]GHF49839.1 cytochrome P450 [Streptomyces mashuensis]